MCQKRYIYLFTWHLRFEETQTLLAVHSDAELVLATLVMLRRLVKDELLKHIFFAHVCPSLT